MLYSPLDFMRNDLQLRVFSTTCIIVYEAAKLGTNNIKNKKRILKVSNKGRAVLSVNTLLYGSVSQFECLKSILKAVYIFPSRPVSRPVMF